MAFTQVVDVSGTNSAGSATTLALGTTISAGDLVVVLARADGQGGPTSGNSTVTGAGVTGGLVRQATDNNITNWTVEVWSGISAGSSADVVVSADSVNGWHFSLSVFRPGAGTTAALLTPAGTSTNSGLNATAASTGTVTPAASANAVLVTCGAFQGSGTSFTVSGFTDLSGGGAGSTPAAYRIVTGTSGGYSATYAAGYNRFAIAIAAFIEVAGGGGQVPPIARGFFWT